jgi:hypothetical protein
MNTLSLGECGELTKNANDSDSDMPSETAGSVC